MLKNKLGRLRMPTTIWLRLFIVFGGYLLLATLVFALLSTFSSPETLPKVAGSVLINGTIFVVPAFSYFLVLRRADTFHRPDGSLRHGLLWALCIGLTLISCFGLMLWFFLLHFGPGVFT